MLHVRDALYHNRVPYKTKTGNEQNNNMNTLPVPYAFSTAHLVADGVAADVTFIVLVRPCPNFSLPNVNWINTSVFLIAEFSPLESVFRMIKDDRIRTAMFGLWKYISVLCLSLLGILPSSATFVTWKINTWAIQLARTLQNHGSLHRVRIIKCG